MAKRKNILFFIQGFAPSAEQKEEAEKLNASFRNVSAHTPGERLELADEVHGAWPAGYEGQNGCKTFGDGLPGIVKAAAVKGEPEPAKKPAK